MYSNKYFDKFIYIFPIIIIFYIWFDNFTYVNNDAINYIDQAFFYRKNNFLDEVLSNSIYPISISFLSSLLNISLHLSAKLIALFSTILIYIFFIMISKIQCRDLHKNLYSSLIFLSSFGFLDNYFFMIIRDNLFILFMLISIFYFIKFHITENKNFILVALFYSLLSAFFRIEGVVITLILTTYVVIQFTRFHIQNSFQIIFLLFIFVGGYFFIIYFSDELKLHEFVSRINTIKFGNNSNVTNLNENFITSTTVFLYFFNTLFILFKVNLLPLIYYLLTPLKINFNKYQLQIVYIYFLPCFLLIYANYISRDVITTRYFMFTHFLILILFNYNLQHYFSSKIISSYHYLKYLIFVFMGFVFFDNILDFNKKYNSNFDNALLINTYLKNKYSYYYVTSNNEKLAYYINYYLNDYNDIVDRVNIYDKSVLTSDESMFNSNNLNSDFKDLGDFEISKKSK